MRLHSCAALALFPLLNVVAQSSGATNSTSSPTGSTASAASSGSGTASAASPSVTVFLSTSISVSIGLDGNRQPTTSTISALQTITSTLAAPQASSNATSQSSSKSSSASIVSTISMIPETQANAPSPGATAGPYGPDDSYTSNALSVFASPVWIALAVVFVGAGQLL